MIKHINNPWESMGIGASRRVTSDIQHNVFWIKDDQGRYGFYLRTAERFANPETDIHLEGVSLIKRNSLEFGELFLILNRQTDWEIFLSICEDIISACTNYNSNDRMVKAVEERLKRWQTFLMSHGSPTMSAELQSGLFCELTALQKLIAKYGIKEGLIAWVGPDKAKHDFNLRELAIEVKSYKTNNGPNITISSAHQLLFESKNLYLLCYGLTVTETGRSLKDLISEFDSVLDSESYTTRKIFENKLLTYGYMPNLKNESLIKFAIDIMKVFEVTQDFPKILPHQIPHEITRVHYTIDLALCRKHERTSSIIFEE